MRATILLVLLAALGLIAAELGGSVAPDATGPAVAERPAPAGPAGLPALDPGRREQWMATVLARPLFAEDRRPRTEARPAPAAAPAVALPRVAGTLVVGVQKRVIFAATGDGKPLVLGEGGEVNGFRVQSIEPGRVTLMGPGGPRTLQASFDPNRPASGPLGAPAPPQGFAGLPTLLPGNPQVPPPQPFPRQIELPGGLQVPGLPLAPPPGR